MLARINDITINYQKTGQGNPVVLLHGWGGNIQNLYPIHKHLEKNYKTFSIDLPGFGNSEKPKTIWNSISYANTLISLFKKLKIENPILIGHSFGGKIAITIASLIKVDKLILLNSAGIKPKRKIKYIFVLPLKSAKKIVTIILPKSIANNIIEFFKKRMGSKDYKQSSNILREILIKSVNEDISNILPSINANTLLIWGENDPETPISSGKIMEQLITNSKLSILKNSGHFAYLDKFNEFISILDNFLKEDNK